MRWPKYWSFSFSIVPFKEIPGLISFRMDERIEANIPWFMQKANKAPGKGLALFTEAADTLSLE